MTLPIGVLASGNGTNLQAVLDACAARTLDARVVLVASNRADARALERAGEAGVAARAFTVKEYGAREAAQRAMAAALREAGAKLVVLAGFDHILADAFFADLGDVPVINVHPALLPLFGGRGMLREKVHEAVLAAGARETGVTVHRAQPGQVDVGEVIVQRKVPVLAGDTAEALAARVLEQEHVAIVEAIGRFTPAGAAERAPR